MNDITKSKFLEKVHRALKTYVSKEYLDDHVISRLLSRFDYCCCDLQDSRNYQKLNQSIVDWSKPIAYYLAISPRLFELASQCLLLKVHKMEPSKKM